MNTSRSPRIRALSALGAAAALVLALTGCEAAVGDAGAPSDSAASPTAVTGLGAEVAAAMAAPGNKVPTEPVENGDALDGKLVYYVPITLQAAQFNVTAVAFTAAMTELGAKVQVCDGKGTPTDVASCVTQGVAAGAAAVVTDAVSYYLGGNSFDAAQAAGVPVVISNQIPDDDHPASRTLGYMANGDFSQQEMTAKWVIDDSDGTGQVLANIAVDSPSPKVFFAAGEKVYDQECPDCTVMTNDVTSANFALVAPSTQAALLAHTDTDYVQAQFAQFLQPTLGGIQGAGVQGAVKVIIGSAQLGDLRALAEGTLTAATGQSAAFTGWLLADLALRLVADEDVPEYTIPARLFTKDNIALVELTEAAEASGAWYGSTDFPADFASIWGR